MVNKYIELTSKKDERGHLLVLESQKNIPFDIKRIYYIYNTTSLARGFHAHKKLKQVIFCIQGSSKVLLDDGVEKHIYELNSPEQGLYIDRCSWREMYDFSEDCILMVLADEHYDEADYIRDYDEFINYVSEKGQTK